MSQQLEPLPMDAESLTMSIELTLIEIWHGNEKFENFEIFDIFTKHLTYTFWQETMDISAYIHSLEFSLCMQGAKYIV